MTTPPTPGTGVTVLALPDALGVGRRIALHPPGHYAIDARGVPSSLLVGPPDQRVYVAAPTRDDLLARLHFPHLGSWDARYLGYENLWMLLSHFPREHSPLNGARIWLPGLSAQRCWLTIRRALVGECITNVTCVGATRAEALSLLTAWLADRVSADWDGEAHHDHTLPFTPLWAEVGGGTFLSLHVTDRTEDAAAAPLIWTVRHEVARPRSRPPLVSTYDYLASDEGETLAACTQFTRLLGGDGDHWRDGPR